MFHTPGEDLSLPKAHSDDFEGRFREVLSDPSNKHIPRVPDAGTLQNGHLVMHNGLLVTPDYYGDFFKILTLNDGVHEPQEERMFMEVLKHLRPGATMVELGAYWAFYSMWFQKEISDGESFLIEPAQDRLDVGRRNFELNGFDGKFFQGEIGPEGIDFKQFLIDQDIHHLDLLHADIQGFELFLLESITSLLEANKISYLFLSTHTQQLHISCLQLLKNHNYKILASADFDHETYCYDGVIVARNQLVAGLEPIQLDVRSSPG